MNSLETWTYTMTDDETNLWYDHDGALSRRYQYELIRRVKIDAERNGCEAFKILDRNRAVAARRPAR